jgi:hypothetical protein
MCEGTNHPCRVDCTESVADTDAVTQGMSASDRCKREERVTRPGCHSALPRASASASDQYLRELMLAGGITNVGLWALGGLGCSLGDGDMTGECESRDSAPGTPAIGCEQFSRDEDKDRCACKRPKIVAAAQETQSYPNGT